jgi:predicted metal-binding protein
MRIDFERLRKICTEQKIDNAAVIDVDKISIRQELRDMCKSNVCGRYGTNWACPPAIGEVEELKATLKEYSKALVMQTISYLEDSFDFEGMMQGKKQHAAIILKIVKMIKEMYPGYPILTLSAGGCERCKECTYLENKPCRFPEELMAPVEGYGIDVTALANISDIPYNNGPSTVSYISVVLFK